MATTASQVLPGQPLTTPGTAASFSGGSGTFTRGGTIFASLVGTLVREGGVISVQGKDDAQAVPEPNNIVIGTITRITRQAATLSLLTVDGRPCRPDFVGVIRSQDVRMTGKDTVKIWGCFRPGDVVRAKVISLGDSRSYFLSTASNSLGVLFAVSSKTGATLEASSWEEMRDPGTGEVEGRKVAGPE